MKLDYLVLSGRIRRPALERALDSGYTVVDFRSHLSESAALVVRSDTAVLSLREQIARLHAAGYLCVHVNPRMEDIRTIVFGTLTYTPGFEDVSPPE